MVKRLFDVIEADFVGRIDNKMNLGQLKGLERRNSPLRIGNGPRRDVYKRQGSKRAPIFLAAGVIFKTIYDELGLTELMASLKSAKDGIIEELAEEAAHG